MSDIGEGFGTAAIGGLFARALEKTHGEKKAGEASSAGDHPESCLNCGTQLVGSHCHECGQRGHVHRSMAAIGHDLMHGVLHLDGKFWHTLPLLAWQPGKLTRRYIDGERAKFVSPMAIFLFSVFAMFAVFQIAGISTPTEINPGGAISEEQLEKSTAQLEAQLDEQKAALAEIPESDPARAEAAQEIANLEQALEVTDTVKKYSLGNNAGLTLGKTGVGWIDKGLHKWEENPGLMLYKLQTNFYKFSWLLIPLSVPFVWLLFFWKRRFHLYDHTVFVTYSLAFMSLLMITLTLLGLAGVTFATLAMTGMILSLWHMHRQLKGTYGIGNVSALWRVGILTVFISIVLSLFLQVLMLVGTMG